MRYTILYISLLLLVLSCSKVEEVTRSISNLSEKEAYQRSENISEELFHIWEERAHKAFSDSIQIELPYNEIGIFKPRNFPVYSYNSYLMPGETLQINVTTDTSGTRIFKELYKYSPDSKSDFIKLTSSDPFESLSFEIKEKGLYKVVIQPEIEAHTPFEIYIDKKPTYLFPVIEGKNSDIGSYWGDIRDGGSRSHKGVDIFAKKGTPVIAATAGRVKFAGEKGLGGKQVWLRDAKRGNSLYYAHLDSIKPDLKKVNPGDTLGFVGNTGNAKYTPAHLHFGIYRNREGAIDPLGYIYQSELMNPEKTEKDVSLRLEVTSPQAILRNKPSSGNSKVLKKARKGEVLLVQGRTADWFHIRDSLDRSMYIHESLVTPSG